MRSFASLRARDAQVLGLQLRLVEQDRVAEARHAVAHLEGLDAQVLPVGQRDRSGGRVDLDDRRDLDLLLGNALEARLGPDPSCEPLGDGLGDEVRGGLLVPQHPAQLPVPRQAASVVAVGVGQEDVVERERRQRALAQVEAAVELGNLQVGGQTRA
ncbi:MAG: hypothetical protein QM765_51460 [Myxococcales bacterium]